MPAPLRLLFTLLSWRNIAYNVTLLKHSYKRADEMKVFGYVRVSTAEQATNGDSLETQKAKIVGYAMMQGWAVDEIFVEAGVSGSVPLADRPQGERLLASVGKGDMIITPKLDRMFRSASDALGTLEEMKGQGTGLVMIDLGGDVTGNGISKLVFTILSAVAENERDRIRERIREVKRHLASQGIYGGGKAPFGFDVVDGRLVDNAEQQFTLAKMQSMRKAGASLRAIGDAIGLKAMSVKRILDRADATIA
ncbi:recombinase family protein [Mesorhizobium sp. M0222]|uniref:recombinase family protein n=1 Tax=Mesorhizobium sp. M0222 TaxID=2956921 RepID=UPI003338C1B4